MNIDEQRPDSIFASSGFNRSVTDETATEFSEGGWSRFCTEDLCPCMPEKVAYKFAKPSQPRWVEVILESNPNSTRTVLTDLTEVIGDLRTVISEATGVTRGNVVLVMNKADNVLLDHELIPSPVMLRGVPLLPKGGMLLGKAQFVQLLLDFKDILTEMCSQGRLRPVDFGTKEKTDFAKPLEEERQYVKELIVQYQGHLMPESCVQPIFEGVQDRVASFKDVKALSAFYHTSNFSNDVHIQEIYSEIKFLLGNPRGWVLDFAEEEDDPVLIGG